MKSAVRQMRLSARAYHRVLKRLGLSEIPCVLKPGGRLVIADFKRPVERQDKPAPFGSIRDLPCLVKGAGFSLVETEEMPFPPFPEGVIFVWARKSQEHAG